MIVNDKASEVAEILIKQHKVDVKEFDIILIISIIIEIIKLMISCSNMTPEKAMKRFKTINTLNAIKLRRLIRSHTKNSHLDDDLLQHAIKKVWFSCTKEDVEKLFEEAK